jgi:hypothetical protein
MEGKINLRAQIEQHFLDNPGKSFGGSELARQFNAKRNTVHYHLKTLKARNFLGQNNEGEYYLAATQENHVVNKEGIINCRYHSAVLNVDWCPSCGNPICGDCISFVPTWMNIGLPLACPECKRKKTNSIMRMYFAAFIVINFIFYFIISYHQDFLIKMLFLCVYVITDVQFLFWLNSWIKEVKKYKIWKRKANGHEIDGEKIRLLIQNKELNSCKYHYNEPGINTCEECGNMMCIKCSTIGPGFPSRDLMCRECNWHKTRKIFRISMILLAIYTGLFLILFLVALAFARGPVPLSFYLVNVPMICIFILILVFVFSIYFKEKDKFHTWKTTIAETIST